jgi:alpha-tubulin suppressor-like RCC1 family protein
MAAGYYFTCAVLTDKKVRCWGNNESGQVGQPASTPVFKTPIEVPSLSNVEMLAATFGSACALLADGTAKCWGANSSAERGVTADGLAHPDPATVAGIEGATFIAGSSGGSFCAIVAGGAIKCWGGNASGELGNGTKSPNEATPVAVCAPGSTSVPCAAASGASFVAGGDNHRCAIFAGGQVACWGNNGAGQLGRPSAELFPANVPGLTATYLTAGNQLTCAAVTGGGAKCWGANFSGRLGNGTDAVASSTPASVCTKADCSTLLSGVTAVTTYDESSCALAGGAVKCWGINSNGQLGDGNASASQSYAATTAVASGAVAVASGGGANFAIVVDRANRDIRCWGSEGYNQCGDGTTTPPGGRKTPIAPKW